MHIWALPLLLSTLLGCAAAAAAGKRRDKGVVDMIRAYNTAAIADAACGGWTETIKENVLGYDPSDGDSPTISAAYDYIMALDFEKSPGDCRLHMYDWPDPSVTPYGGLFHSFLKTGKIRVGYITGDCIEIESTEGIIDYQKNILENIIKHYHASSDKSDGTKNFVNFVEVGQWNCSPQDISDAMNKLRDGEVDVLLGALPMLDNFMNNGVFGCATFGDDIGIIRQVRNSELEPSDEWKYCGTLQETIKYIINSGQNYAIVTRSSSAIRNMLLGVPKENIFDPNAETSFGKKDIIYYIDETVYILKAFGDKGEFIHNFFNSPIYKYGPMFPFAGYIEGYGNSQLTQALNYAIDQFFKEPEKSSRPVIDNKRYYELLDVTCPAGQRCRFSLPINYYKKEDGTCDHTMRNSFENSRTICLNSLQKVWVQTYYPLLYLGNENAFNTYGTILIPEFGFPGTTGFKALPKSSVTKYGKLNYAIISGYLKYGVGPGHYGYNTANSFISNVINSLGVYLGEKYGRTVSFVEVFDSFSDENRARCMLSGQTPTSKEYGQVKPSADFVFASKLNLDEYYSDYTIDLFHNFYVQVQKGTWEDIPEEEKKEEEKKEEENKPKEEEEGEEGEDSGGGGEPGGDDSGGDSGGGSGGDDSGGDGGDDGGGNEPGDGGDSGDNTGDNTDDNTGDNTGEDTNEDTDENTEEDKQPVPGGGDESGGENDSNVVTKNNVILTASNDELEGKYNTNSNEIKVRKLMTDTQDVIAIETPRFMTSWQQLYLVGDTRAKNLNDGLLYETNSNISGSTCNLQISFDYNQPEIEKPRDELAKKYSEVALIFSVISLVLGIVLFILHLFGKDTPKYVEDNSSAVPQITVSRSAMIAAPIAAAPLPDAELL